MIVRQPQKVAEAFGKCAGHAFERISIYFLLFEFILEGLLWSNELGCPD